MTTEPAATGTPEPLEPDPTTPPPPAPAPDPAKVPETDHARENVFLRAGVDLESPVGKLLYDGYKGELTKEAVVLAAKEVGALVTHEPPAPVATDEADQRHALASGADHVADAPPDPYKAAQDAAQAARVKGAPEESVLAAGFHEIAMAGVNGDERVLAKRVAAG